MPPRRPDQLRAGRHGLSREAVVAHQRARMLTAVGEEVAALGYGPMTVEDVIARAGVSRRTFYDHFTGKEEIYLEAQEAFRSELVEAVRSALPESASLAEWLAAGLDAVLGFVSVRPAAARTFLSEVVGAGEHARSRRDAAVAEAAVALDAAAARDPQRLQPVGPAALTAQLAVGGVYQIVLSRLLVGEAADLPTLLPDLVQVMLTVFLGPDQARSARELRALSAPNPA